MMAIVFAAFLMAATPGEQANNPAPPIPVQPAPAPPWPEPPELVRATLDDVVRHLGPPLRDNRALVGQGSRILDFAGRNCELTLFFSSDEAGVWRSTHIFRITPDGDVIDPNSCYASIREQLRIRSAL